MSSCQRVKTYECSILTSKVESILNLTKILLPHPESFFSFPDNEFLPNSKSEIMINGCNCDIPTHNSHLKGWTYAESLPREGAMRVASP